MQSAPAMQNSLRYPAALHVKAKPAAQRRVVARRHSDVLRIRELYDRFAAQDTELADELSEIEDLVFDPRSGASSKERVRSRQEAMCSLLHRLAVHHSYDRYEDPTSGFEVFTSEALRRQEW